MTTPMSTLKNQVGIICLHCGQTQLPPNRSTLDNWTCGNCFSGFLSIVMLSNLVERDVVAQILKTRQVSPKSRPCPRCHHKMEMAEITHQRNSLSLDLCRRCHLCWFDSGTIMRLLNHRSKEKFETLSDKSAREKELGQPPSKKPAPEPESAPGAIFIPWATVGIFFLCAVLLPIATHLPNVVSRFGFLPTHPFRGLGLTWITSLFLNYNHQMHSMFALLLMGTYVERRLGPERFLKLFLASGIAGRLVYILSRAPEDSVVIGTSQAICGIVAYCLLTVPYRDFLFPDERWKSPMTPILWWIIGSVTVLNIYLGWDFFHVAFSKVAYGANSASTHGTVIGILRELLATPACRAHLLGAAVGLIWLGCEPFLRPLRKRAPT